ncbi:MAG: terminase large subunit domain-containing protein [Schwartzia sp. (in: firmicutes)]
METRDAARRITIPYRPERLWREKIHPGLEGHRFSVLVAHRRFGKTVGTVNHMIKMAVKNTRRAPRYAYIAPYRNQAKMIAWEYLKFYTHVIPKIRVNESDLYVELPCRRDYEGAAGARLYIVGADHPDALRGGYWDGVILDEYAQIKKELWDEIINPAIADRKGWVVFIGTPKGQNQFYEIYLKAQKAKDWYTALYRAEESGVFAKGGRFGPEELARMKADMTSLAIRQELECDFTASAANVLITIDTVTAATERTYRSEEIAGAPRILGVDVARFGDDSSVLFRRQGLVAYPPRVITDADNMTLAGQVAEEIRRFRPDVVFVDSGRGEGVIDRLRQLGHRVTEVNFGGKADDAGRYANKRMEMWARMADWLKEGGSIPNLSDLKTELSAPEYFFTRSGHLQLEAKEDIKEKLGRSPDTADALALTFSYHVAPSDEVRPRRCHTEYNF